MTPVTQQSLYVHSFWWLCSLRGAWILPPFSWYRYKILLSILDVDSIINIYHFRSITIQIRCGMLTPTVPLRLWPKINKWKFPTLDTLKRFQHHRSSCQTPIFKWISRTHMAYSDPNCESIHHRKAGWTRILVLRGSPCINDAQPGSWLLTPETRHTFWTRQQFQTRLQDMVWIILYRIFQSWNIQHWDLFWTVSTYTEYNCSC